MAIDSPAKVREKIHTMEESDVNDVSQVGFLKSGLLFKWNAFNPLGWGGEGCSWGLLRNTLMVPIKLIFYGCML